MLTITPTVAFQVNHVITDSKLNLVELGEVRNLHEQIKRAVEKLSREDLERKVAVLLTNSDNALKVLWCYSLLQLKSSH